MTDWETRREPPACRTHPATTTSAERSALMRYFYPPSLYFAPQFVVEATDINLTASRQNATDGL